MDLRDPPLPEDINDYSPADMDLTFHKYIAQYRQELVDRECSRLLIARRAQIERRKLPFGYGSQCTCIASPSTEFFIERDRSDSCHYFSIQKGKENEEDDRPTRFVWTRKRILSKVAFAHL